MAQLTIVTTPQNSGDGTPLATAFNYCNSNFSELYSRVQTDPPISLVGTFGDTAGMYAYDSSFFYYCFADYDGSTVIWGQLAQTGNISVTSISLGTSNVSIDDLGAPITMSVGGLSNVVVVSTTGQYVDGVVSATGNVTGDYILGNGSQLTGLPATYTDANVVTLLSSFGSNTISTNGNISAGNVNGANIDTVGTVSATGNIVTAGFFVGNFTGNIVANITNIPGPGGAVVFNDGAGNVAATAGLVFDNSGPNVLNILGAVSATGNVDAGNLRTTGFVFTTANVVAGNVNSNDIVYAAGNVVGNNINSLARVVAIGNITGGNIITGGQISATGNIRTTGFLNVIQDVNVGGDISAANYTGVTVAATANITGGNINTGGRVSATGNIIGNYIIGNGSLLTDVNVSTLQNGNSNVLIGGSAGNISVNVNGIAPVALFTPLGQDVIGNLLVTGAVSAISVSGGIMTGTSLSVTGNVVSAILSATGNATVGNLETSGSITATGNTTVGNLETSGSITATGNATVGNLNVGTGTVTLGNIINANGNAIGNIGSDTNYFNTVFAQSTSAVYADLAENYLPDQAYAPGVVVIFGGDAEITICTEFADARVAGVISDKPAHLMNAGADGIPVALRGRVKVNVMGPVTKGDGLVTDSIPGSAKSIGLDRTYGQAVFAKSLETNLDPGQKIIEAVIL